MLITGRFTSTIIAAYGNHNKDEACHGEEMSRTDLVYHGNMCSASQHHMWAHFLADEFNSASIVLFCCMTMLHEADRQEEAFNYTKDISMLLHG